MTNRLLGFSPILPSSPDAKALGLGLFLGQDDGFSRELTQLTRSAGVAHLTAASGANISLFQRLLTPLEGSFWTLTLLQFLTVGVYWQLSGASGSLWRASLLALYSLGALVCGRALHQTWSLGGILCLTLATPWRESLGFWFSWLAVVGLQISQKTLSGENGHPLSPQYWPLYNFLQKMLISGSLILILVSVVAYRVFGTWQPHGLLGTALSSPLLPLYMLCYALQVLFYESNKVALKWMTSVDQHSLSSWPGAGLAVLSGVEGGLLICLQFLLAILLGIWTGVTLLPGFVSTALVVGSVGWAGWLALTRARRRSYKRRQAQLWGWVP